MKTLYFKNSSKLGHEMWAHNIIITNVNVNCKFI